MGSRKVPALLVGLVLFSILMYGCSHSPSNTTNSSPTPFPSNTITSHSTPIKTSTTIPVSSPSPTSTYDTSGQAVLGGKIGAFIAKYGSPTEGSIISDGQYNFNGFSNSNNVSLTVSTDLPDGKRYDQTVYVISASPDNGTWDTYTAETTCKMFFPPDSVYKYKVQVSNGGGTSLFGYDVIYYSASLRQAFPASSFQDANGNQTTPGLFDVVYPYGNFDNTSIADCIISIGTQGTK